MIEAAIRAFVTSQLQYHHLVGPDYESLGPCHPASVSEFRRRNVPPNSTNQPSAAQSTGRAAVGITRPPTTNSMAKRQLVKTPELRCRAAAIR